MVTFIDAKNPACIPNPTYTWVVAFLYRNQPMCKDLVSAHLKTAGKRVGIKVHPHRLRHTAATQLVNANCPIVLIQKFLGHK